MTKTQWANDSSMLKLCFPTVLLQLLWPLMLSMRAQAQPPAAHNALEEPTKSLINMNNLPQHVAIIMDGNGRWATKQGKSRVFGHQNAIQSVREVVEACAELGIPYLTLYGFSIENWERPKTEVESLMNLIAITIDNELTELVQNNVRLIFVGDLQRLPQRCQQSIQKASKASQSNKGLSLIVALSYSGRWDIVEATKAIVRDVQTGKLASQDINTDLLKQYLAIQDIPDPALLIRTSGEMRLSNFILWQLAYTELFFTPVLWPDFRKSHLYEAILDYQKRERRFGKIGD